MIQLTRQGMVVTDQAGELERLQAEFEQQHCIRIRQLLHPELLQRVLADIAQAEFAERRHINSGIVPPPVDFLMAHNSADRLLHFLANDAAFLRMIERITGCDHIAKFGGYVYRIAPQLGHFDSWHDDVGRGRMVAMSLNVTDGLFEGGLLQIKHWASGTLVHEVANTGVGDAIFFRVSEQLKHRVSPVEGTVARTAFAGWFCGDVERSAGT